MSLLLFLNLLLACSNSNMQSTEQQSFGKEINGPAFVIKGEITNIKSDTIRLYDYYGIEFNELAYTIVSKNEKGGTFELKGNIPEKGIYFLGSDSKNGSYFIVGADKEFTVTGDGVNLSTLKASNSPENTEYQQFMQKTAELQAQLQSLSQKIQQNPADATLRQSYDTVVKLQTAYHQTFIKQNTIVGLLAKIFYMEPFGSDPSHQAYKTDIEYIKNAFFKNIPLKDTSIGYIPQFFDKVNYYTSWILSQGTSNKEAAAKISDLIKQLNPKSKAVEMFYIGSISGAARMQQMDLYFELAEKYLKEFPSGRFSDRFKKDVAGAGNTRVGSPAPDIILNNPEGKQLKLSSLKGKVVLLDFWSSWCGPCRKENPNVVKLYQQYKTKGFEIFGVSLDNSKDKWIQAIKADNLTWLHVSDLGGWQSAPAKLYQVSSIPTTFLIDKKGNILAKGLRGQALEQKLAQLFP